MADLVHLPAKSSQDAILEVINRDGGVIIDNLIDQALLNDLKLELAPYLTAAGGGQNEFTGFSTERIGALIARSEACRKLAMDKLVLGSAKTFLEPHGGTQLHFTQAVNIRPGETAQTLHRDRGLWGGHVPRRIETQFSTIWAATEFRRENGATMVVPGSQRWDADRQPKPDEIAYAEMSPGSVLLYTGTVIHGGGANVTDMPRLAVLIHYALDWLRQEENQYLSCPADIAKTLDPELRALIGYSQGGPLLGFYSTPGAPGEGVELEDPQTLFE